MYKIGDYISYGNSGVCEVVGIEMRISPGDSVQSRQCYILTPLHDPSCRITTPVDNTKVVMRNLITPDETDHLLHSIAELEVLPEQSARQQEIAYAKALHSGSCREWMSLVKTLHLRIEERRNSGKKITATDDRYFKAVVTKLVEEFSVVLHLDMQEARSLLLSAFGIRSA